ncbi:RNA polymerase recycling motor HelD [Clostridium vincentii]|uniref:Helicase IV n=1 Tax=Clostridium vincentii TaxID=52704 RepID=A0A2T0BHM0_9CLOT|nr:RNA polymerase recycling motor HelD [Clostridium vincentii]PRR83390.1 Helicase IV [Clostridium vincentii]
MKKNMREEKEILIEKRELIKEEIQEKQSNINAIEQKVKNISRESGGGYSEEKETTDKVYEVLTREITSYEDVLKEPYFGRVDFREHRGLEESIYIGKKGISNVKKGEEVVVDWRAPVADLYYSGTGGEAFYKAPNRIIEGELSLKRKFLFNDEEIEKVFDEGINELMINGEAGQGLIDELLKVNLEESRGKKLREVVATIQKEQNEIIRWPKNLPIIVQGSAGSGKTTIALHRLAYLIYRYRETMEGKDILVLAPNKLFLDYISDILPSLGASQVEQDTFEELVLSKLKIKSKIYNKDEKLKSIMEEKDEDKKKLIVDSSEIKGKLIYKAMIDRYITLVESKELDIEDIIVANEVLFSKKEILRLYLKDLKSYPINKRKDEIKRYLNLKIKERVNVLLYKTDLQWDIKIKEVRLSGEDSKERREALIAVYDERDKIKNDISKNAKKQLNLYFKNWRGIGSKDIYYNFFNDEELFSIATDNEIPDDLYKFMRDEFNENYENNIIDEDDLPTLLYIRIILEGIAESEKFEHIVVDEAQDYSPFQVFLVNMIAKRNSLTLVGDLAQGIYYYKGIKTWDDITLGLFNGEATYVQLTQSYRSTVEIIELAQGALNAQNLGLKNAKPVLRHGEKPYIKKVSHEDEYPKTIDEIIDEVKNKEKSTVAIITKNSEEALILDKILKKKSKYSFELIKGKEKEVQKELIIIPSYLTKGLEFDATIIFNPSTETYGDNLLDQRLLYVSLTRALHLEYVIEKDNITTLLEPYNVKG